MNNTDLLTELKRQMQEQGYLQNSICEVCGETNPYALRIFENHHLHTRGYSDETCVLCLNCHTIVTAHQNNVPVGLRDAQLPLERRTLFILLSHAALEQRMAEVKIRVLRQQIEVKGSG